MNVDKTMLELYEAHQRLKCLAVELKSKGSQVAAAELDREAEKLGAQLVQIEGVLGEHWMAIAATLQEAVNENPPRFIGVDMSKPDSDRAFCNGVMYR